MPSITDALIEPLQQRLHLKRAVETGAYRGDGAKRLSRHFPEVVSIELSPHYASLAAAAVSDLPNASIIQGHSAQAIPGLVDPTKPTLWFLDGHWSAGDTAGADDECPVLRELVAMQGGHDDDVIVVDDARLFLSSPPPPMDPKRWPSLLEVIDALRVVQARHHITLLNDQVIAVPAQARLALDDYVASLRPPVPTLSVVAKSAINAITYRTNFRHARPKA